MSAPSLRILLSKAADGDTVLRCERADGTATWQRHHDGQAFFFPLHDLTHYAIETTLGFGSAFYGLVSAGWDLRDFGPPWPRGPLPPEASIAEFLVGCFDLERAASQEWPAAEFGESGVRYFSSAAERLHWPSLSEAELARVRGVRRDLFARWHALPPSGTLELSFPGNSPLDPLCSSR